MSSFAKRVVRFNKPKSELTALEKTGDSLAIAAEQVDLSVQMEEMPIRQPRASNLYDACMRMYVLGTIHERTKKQWENFNDRILFGIGNALHYWVQNEPEVFGDKRIGWWLCKSCGKIRYFGAPPKKKCSCGASHKASVYHEHSLSVKEQDFHVTGHPDMFLEYAKGKPPRIVEIKSISGPAFELLIAPLVQHEWQLTTYMWASSLDKNLPMAIDNEVGYMLYISKRHQSKILPIKMFPVVRSDAVVGMIKAKLASYTEGVKSFPNNLPPLQKDCDRTSLTCYRANSCPVRRECYNHMTAEDRKAVKL